MMSQTVKGLTALRLLMVLLNRISPGILREHIIEYSLLK